MPGNRVQNSGKLEAREGTIVSEMSEFHPGGRILGGFVHNDDDDAKGYSSDLVLSNGVCQIQSRIHQYLLQSAILSQVPWRRKLERQSKSRPVPCLAGSKAIQENDTRDERT